MGLFLAILKMRKLSLRAASGGAKRQCLRRILVNEKRTLAAR